MINLQSMEEQFGNPATTSQINVGDVVWLGSDGYIGLRPEVEFPSQQGTVISVEQLEHAMLYTVYFRQSNVTLACTTGKRTMTTPYDNFEKRVDVQVRRFECTTGGHRKFWELTINWVDGTYFTTWGRIGNEGQVSSTKTASQSRSNSQKRAALKAEAIRLVTSKINKGYVEKTKKTPPKKKISKKKKTINEIKRRPLCLLD